MTLPDNTPPPCPETTAALIVAAGRGTRAGGELPKQWQMLRGRTVAAHTLARFTGHPRVGPVVLVIHPDDRAVAEKVAEAVVQEAAQEVTQEVAGERVTLVMGRDTRAGSVQAGLAALGSDVTHVLIHDVARPGISSAVIDAVIDALAGHAGAAPGLPVTDALWTGDAARVTGTRDRTGLYAAQTPQGFALAAIRAAHDAYTGPAADDVEVARAAGIDVVIVPGDAANLKITTQSDFARADRELQGDMDVRTGQGFDVHALCDGDHVTLCGVRIPHDRGLLGHSDADVGMHALTDAIYGALAAGDIGTHFPPSDPRWKGAASHIFLRHAAEMADAQGWRITHCDVTLICEYPRIGPHAQAMRGALASVLGLEVSRVSVKATTSEQLGFTGRKEGIAALATATLVTK